MNLYLVCICYSLIYTQVFAAALCMCSWCSFHKLLVLFTGLAIHRLFLITYSMEAVLHVRNMAKTAFEAATSKRIAQL